MHLKGKDCFILSVKITVRISCNLLNHSILKTSWLPYIKKEFFFLNREFCNHFKLSHHDMPSCDKEHTAVRSVNRRCLLLQGTRSNLYLFRGSCYSALNLYFTLWIFEMVDLFLLSFFIKIWKKYEILFHSGKVWSFNF